VVRSAVLSDRVAARRQAVGLCVADGAVHAVSVDGSTRPLTGPVRSMAWAPWATLPAGLGVVTAAGAVVATDPDGVHVFPIDPWWMEPSPAARPAAAVSSSGFADLAERLGITIASDPDAVLGLRRLETAAVHVPRSDAAEDRSRPRTFVVMLLLATTLIGAPLALVVLGRGWTEGLTLLGWLCVAASALALANLLIGVQGRRRAPWRTADRLLRPAAGPRWFRDHARVGVRGGLLWIDDGRGQTTLLATPTATASVSAVVRARTVGGKRPRIVLVDGVDVVRAELPLGLWPADELDDLLLDRSIVRDPSSERRSSTHVRFDTHHAAQLPGASLVTRTALGVVPLVPLLLATVLQLMVSVFARIGGALPQSVALAIAFASVSVVLVVVGTELGSRLPAPDGTPAGFRPTRTFASVVGWSALFVGLAALLVAVDDAGTAAYALTLAVASVPFQWCLYRYRALRADRGVLGLPTWLRTGCPS